MPGLLDLLALAQLPGDATAALATARRLIALDPDGHRGYLLAALASIRLRRRKDERAYAKRAVELAPNIAALHALYAESLAGARRRYKKAIASAQHAIELAPEDTAGYMAAGTVELLRGRKNRADGWYRKALDLDPTNTTAQASLALTDRVRYRLNQAFAGAQAVLQYGYPTATSFVVNMFRGGNLVYSTIAGGSVTAYQLAAVALADGRVVAILDTGSALVHTTLLPGLTVKATKKTASISDDGIGVKATLKGGGKTVVTNAAGVAKLSSFPRGTRNHGYGVWLRRVVVSQGLNRDWTAASGR